MELFNSVSNKIGNWGKENSISPLRISGISPSQWSLFLTISNNCDLLQSKNMLMVCSTVEQAEDSYSTLKDKLNSDYWKVILFPGLESSPYSSFMQSESALYARFYAINNILNAEIAKKKLMVICTQESFLLKIPPKQFFNDNSFKIEISDIIPPQNLAETLVSIGYIPTLTASDPGTFSKKGEIFDIFPVSTNPVRIQYFDDMVENIFPIDTEDQKSDRSVFIKSVIVAPAPNIFVNSEFRTNIRENIPTPQSAGVRMVFRKQILSSLVDNCLFDNYPVYIPLFFKSEMTSTILDYFDLDETVVSFVESDASFDDMTRFIEELRDDYNRVKNDQNSENILPEPSFFYNLNVEELLLPIKKIYINQLDVVTDLTNHTDQLKNSINVKLSRSVDFLSKHIKMKGEKSSYLKDVLKFIESFFKYHGEIYFTYSTQSSKTEICYLMDLFEFSSDVKDRFNFIDFPLTDGFYYASENILVITESDFFARKRKKIKKSSHKQIDLFAEQISTLKENDYVIHSTYGIGKYLGLETIKIGTPYETDYLVIMYENKDKIYVPVYKMNLVQKHASADASVKCASLRSNKFINQKNKARQSAKKLAFDLLKLQAERELSKAHAFSEPDHMFSEFELDFPFEETGDQNLAIKNVIERMQSQTPMDHLVCGDVGFGKTEVAMRASYLAVLDKKQVAILVPTTILALQHYNSFCNRFKNFPVQIEFLSRFKSPKDVILIKERLKDHRIDILIGTHKILSATVEFNDLGLVVVDEEQRFGVTHKEKLKLLKSSVDFLTLTATPIPRTLQLAFLGLRDLSLIQMAPPKRQSIRTYVIKDDDSTIKDAIEKELSRGGQVFYVHNRVKEMDSIHQKINALVPHAKVLVAHGQLKERELEKRMEQFYSGEYNVLLSTTIIESGLDVANANTIIINRADNFGLSQLHQLRGRIGRSDRKAYAYFIIPKVKALTAVQHARIKALQTYADMGSGFSIASCDLEIRGAGDILGAGQSGHVEAIGLELYMELLKETIAELKGEINIVQKDIEVSTCFPAYIPHKYITESGERLKYYKKISNCKTAEELSFVQDEILDIFGIYPQEVEGIFTLLKVRTNLQHLGLRALKLLDYSIIMEFDQNILNKDKQLCDKVIQTFINMPRTTMSPDYKVVCKFKKKMEPLDFIAFTSAIDKN